MDGGRRIVGGHLGIGLCTATPQNRVRNGFTGGVLGTAQEIRWAFVDGPQTTRPDLWHAYLSSMPAGDRGDPIAALTRRLHGTDDADRDCAAHIWGEYERALSQLKPTPAIPLALTEPPSSDVPVPNTPRFESYYFQNDCWNY